MKRIISVLLTVVMLITLSVPAFASEEVDISQNSSTFSCVFDTEKNTISIKGTINHDVLVKYGNYTIYIYKIPLNTTYQEAIKNADNRVISNEPISIKFEYAVKVSSIEDRFAKYALVLSSRAGDTYLASEMKIPTVSGEYEYTNSDKSDFKGIEIDNIARASNLSPGTAIINVDLDSLYGNASNCYLYPMGDTFAYIDKSVISELDSKIMTLSQAGARIYLRFLVLSEGNIISISGDTETADLPYTIPNIYDPQTLDFVCAASSFIAERYNGSAHGYMNGVVLGTKMDDVENVNHRQGLTFDEYVDRYVIYMLSVANSMRSVNPTIDIVVPVSDANDYSLGQESTARGTELIEGIISELKTSFSDEPLFSVMLEIEGAPFGISNDTLNNIIDTSSPKEYSETISIENIEDFARYFKELSERFDNAPLSYSVLWNVPNKLSGNALSCAYAYSYYKLFSMEGLSSFIVSFAEDSVNGVSNFDELANIFRYIDTEKTFEVTENILKYFGVDSWSKILHTKSASAYAVKTYYEMSLLNTLPNDAKGGFEYFDFSSSSSANNWKSGINTKSTKAEYSTNGVRALHINSRKLTCGDSFEFYYLYDSVESFAYTPYLVLDLNVDALDTGNAVFEINVMLGNDSSIAYASKAFASGESGQMILSIHDFNENNKAQYLKISIRALNDNAESVSVWLNSVKGYSTEYDDSDLASVIKMERLRTQDNAEDDDEKLSDITAVTIILVIVVIIAIGIALLVIFRKEDEI